MLVKASLCLETAEKPQLPRLYPLGRPRTCDRMPSLVGDRGPVVPVLGWENAQQIVGIMQQHKSRKLNRVVCGTEPWVVKRHKGERWG